MPQDDSWKRDFALQEIEVGLIFAQAGIEAFGSNRKQDGAAAKARAITAMENVQSVIVDLERNDQILVGKALVKLRYALYTLKSLR